MSGKGRQGLGVNLDIRLLAEFSLPDKEGAECVLYCDLQC